jgi:toxin ParE1/3/4
VKVRWTEPAVSQLQQIHSYIARDNPHAAQKTVRTIAAAIERAAKLPFAARPGRITDTRELVVPGTSYLVVFRIVDNSIHILAILHGAQSWPESL